MDFNYRDHFDAAPSTDYETLIYDCMIGDPTLFQHADNIEAGWRAVEPILEAWREVGGSDLAAHAPGSNGSRAAETLLARGGHEWRTVA